VNEGVGFVFVVGSHVEQFNMRAWLNETNFWEAFANEWGSEFESISSRRACRARGTAHRLQDGGLRMK
jgi:hypothetical protein